MLRRSVLAAQWQQDLFQLLQLTTRLAQQHLLCSPQPPAAAAAAAAIHTTGGICSSRELSAPLQHLFRAFSTSSNSCQQQGRLVTAFIEDVLSSLSIPHAELDQLASSSLSDAALTAWALTKTASHPALQEAAAASHRLQHLLTKLDGALLWQQQAASSPLGQLLWQVAVGVGGSDVAGLDPEQLEGRIEYQVVAALTRDIGRQHGAQLLQQLVHQLHHMTDTPPLAALSHPAFWQLAQQAVASSPALAQDLPLLGYDLASADAAATQLQQLQQVVQLNAASLQQQLKKDARISSSLLQPGKTKQLLAAVSGDAEARKAAAQLVLLQVLAEALGLSAVQIGSPVSSCELVARLTGLPPPTRELGQQLQVKLASAAPALLAAVSMLPAAALEQASVGSLLQLLGSKPELQELSSVLTGWRAEAAAAGYLPVLTTLTQPEVAALPKAAAESLGRAMMQLEARGQLLLRQAAAKALHPGQLAAGDAAALAWKVHTGGAAAAEELVQLVLEQASQVYASAVAELEAAEGALASMDVGFRLEEAVSRRSSAAPPSTLLMAGVPQHQVSELSKSLPSLGTTIHAGGSSSAAAESLVRDLAMLLSIDSAPSSTRALGGAAAAQRLQVIAHDLPKVLCGPLLELISSHQQHGGVRDAAGARQQQQQLRAFVAALEAELPRMAATAAARVGSPSSSAWAAASSAVGVPADAAEGLLELLGEQDAAELLAKAAAKPGSPDAVEQQQGLYDMLADIHHDVDIQRYLQMEFDPALELDVVHAPNGWQAADLFVSPAEFLDSMKPLLDDYLAAQGQPPVQKLEWQVYRDAALAEHEQVELAASDARRAAGHSPFNNSRADQAYLSQRLDAAIPKDSVLYAAARKYLDATFRNRSWTFVQRKRLVDRLADIAGHLAAHPPRVHRGSPFSALFQPDGPPAAPRLSRTVMQPGTVASVDDKDAYALPAGFGPGH